MPLYSILENGDIPLFDKAHYRLAWSRLIMRANTFLMTNGVSPRIYTGLKSFDIISQSTSFSFADVHKVVVENFMGHFMGFNVFLSNELEDDEYVLGLSEQEVKFCKRRDKLKQIINKLNATI